MRWVWAGLVVLSAVLVSVAHADTVYLKDGEAIWGTEAYEEGSEVVLVRPSGPVRFPKSQVDRIEPAKISLPRFYSPPDTTLTSPAGQPAVPGAPAPSAGGAGSSGVPAVPRSSSEGESMSPPSTPAELPPAPPPPAPGR